MKKSRLYLSTTIAGIGIFIILSVIYARLFGVQDEANYTPARPGAAELSALTGFNSINVQGDFRVEVRQQPNFSVEYEADTIEGELRAEVVDAELRLSGFGNRSDIGTSVVRIGLPELLKLQANYLSQVTIAAFNAPELTLGFTNTRSVLLRDNRIQTLTLSATAVRELRLQANAFGSEELEIRGVTTVISSD